VADGSTRGAAKRGADLDEAVKDAPGSTGLQPDKLAAWLRPLANPLRLRILWFLTEPHHLEEVAAHLGISRQGTRKHLDMLVDIGVVERIEGKRERVVMEYVIRPQALFLIYDNFEKLSTLRSSRDAAAGAAGATMHGAGDAPRAAHASGPGLWVVRGLRTGSAWPLTRLRDETWVIGRDRGCALCVDYDPYASNRHAEVRWDGSRFLLTDLRSTNGTTHNWSFLARGASAPLAHGDLLGVGKTLLLFRDDRLG